MKYNLNLRRKTHLISLGTVTGEKVHKPPLQGMEVAYYQTRLLTIVLKREGRVRRVTDQLTHLITLGKVTGEKVHKRLLQGMEVAYYQADC